MIKNERELFDEIYKGFNRLNKEGLNKLHPFLLALLTFDELVKPAKDEVNKRRPEYLRVVK